MPRVLITTSSFDLEQNRALQQLQLTGIQITANPYGKRLTESEVAGLLDSDVVGMVAGVEPLTRPVMAKATGLKVISRCGIGLDNVDLEAAGELGIRVLNTPDAPTNAVAELTLALMLAVLRRVAQADRAMRQGEWKPQMGNLLSARTVGIVGYGRVGRQVAHLVHAFGARILAHDTQAVEMPDHVERADLASLLKRSDIVTLHVPLAGRRDYLIGRQQLMLMRPGAFLVNTARGGLVDEAALLEALQSGRLAGAACDVFEKEPYRGPLAELPQVLLTAHMGSYAKEARALMEQEAARNLVDALIDCGILKQGAAAKRG